MQNTKLLIFIYLFIILSYNSFSVETKYLTTKPKKGEGILSILARYDLPQDTLNINKFKEINKGKFSKSGDLLKDKIYNLPVIIYKFDGKSIRTTLGIKDYNLAKEIEKFNIELLRKNLIKSSYKVSLNLLVPIFLIDSTKKELKTPEQKIPEYPIFGEKYKQVKIIDTTLKNYVYYLVSGHGGSDPGAIGIKDKKELCEDEYAYDITLRLARKLIEYSATVYMIVQDTVNGIRDEEYLICDKSEILHGGDTIAAIQIDRLKQRVDIINKLYDENASNSKLQQVVEIHLDSRNSDKRIDIFYYYNPNSDVGFELANTLYSTIKNKYDSKQPGRGYQGFITSRGLYTLQNTKPTAVYLELGNIQNKNDQIRFIQVNNRQAIANWLCEGLIKASKK